MEPQHGEPRARQDTQQEDLDPDQVLATIQALQLDLDFCRDTNDKQLVQLEELEDVVEQEHQELAILTQQFQALMDKVPVLDMADIDKLHSTTGWAPCLPQSVGKHLVAPQGREENILPVTRGSSTTCTEQPSHKASLAGTAQSTQMSKARRMQTLTALLTPWAPSQGWWHCCNPKPCQ